MTFTHLHLHTEYSLLDGAIRLKDLPRRLKELGMTGCAITDHGALYGVLDFVRLLKSEGLHPIVGCEVYVAPRRLTDKEGARDKEPAHLILLAENQTGYHNLIKLVSIGYVDGFYYRPRIDHETLRAHSAGLIALSACLAGEIPRLILENNLEQAAEQIRMYDALFGRDNFFLEIQQNGIPEQNIVNAALIRLAGQTGVPLVATNDCHYLTQEDAYAHEVLLCMQTGKRMSDPDRMQMHSDQFYIKSPAEMAAAFSQVPEAIENTARIAARCQVDVETGQIFLPEFKPLPAGLSHVEYLAQCCQDGLEARLEGVKKTHEKAAYQERLNYELSVINEMGFTDYYLVVWDFIRYAREKGIMVGPGRGSGAGSLAAWCLRITNIDPLEYGLLFERFLNPERVSLPDFDIDFCYERRGEVIDYVMQKYGEDHVSQVITFGTLAARACIRDVARALDVPYVEADRIAKMVPFALNITLDKALQINPELSADYTNNEITKQIIDLARRFEGMPRHASTHAAGVIIAGTPITEIAPLAKNEDNIVVQLTKDNLESVGLLKFDFLGLRTLTVIQDTVDMVAANHGIQLEMDSIPFDDPQVFKMIGDGETAGVFQLESEGMTAFMKELRPETMEDIIAGISLYRPGPMDQIPRFVASRHDPAKIRYDHPLEESVLEVTYGCMIYQEQAMQIVRDIGGFSMGQSDNIRRAMSKKRPEVMAAYEHLFIHGGTDETGREVQGAIRNGVPEATARKIFEDVTAFAGYAFNKSHAAAYAVVAWQTAWLKYYYPVEFMAAMLNSFLGNLGQAAHYIRVCKAMQIKVYPPDINESGARFQTQGGGIRFALGGIKNVGNSAIRQVIAEREAQGPFTSFGNFMRRMTGQELNRKMIDSLVRASALDGFGIDRAKLLAVIEPFGQQLAQARKQRMDGQLSLFEFSDEMRANNQDHDEPVYPETQVFSHLDRLAMEKEVLGLYVTGHPLDDYLDAITRLTTCTSSRFMEAAPETAAELAADWVERDRVEDQEPVIMCGLLNSRTNKLTRNQDLMAFITLEDLDGSYEVLVFPKVLEQAGDLLQMNAVLLVAGRLSVREDEPVKVLAEQFALLEPDQRELPPGFRLPYDRRGQAVNGQAHRRQRAADVRPAATRSSGAPVVPVSTASSHKLAIRWRHAADKASLSPLLATLRYFYGQTPVVLYLEQEDRLLDLGHQFAIDSSPEVLTLLRARYGTKNVGLL